MCQYYLSIYAFIKIKTARYYRNKKSIYRVVHRNYYCQQKNVLSPVFFLDYPLHYAKEKIIYFCFFCNPEVISSRNIFQRNYNRKICKRGNFFLEVLIYFLSSICSQVEFPSLVIFYFY